MVRHFGIPLALFCASFYLTVPAFALQQLKGHVPREAATAPLLGDMDPAQMMDLSIALTWRNRDEMKRLIDELYDPHSSSYRHFITPAETTARFAPDPADYQAVLDFAAAHHLTVTKTFANHALVNLRGRVDDVQKTFHVRLKRYSRSGGGEFHAPDREPSVDLDVPLDHIQGLENAQLARRSLTRTSVNSPAQPQSGSGMMGRYVGNDFRNIYFPGLPNAYLGAGQTIALIEFDVYDSSDITGYANAAAMTASGGTAALQPQLVNELGPDTYQNNPGNDTDEVTLDIEMAFAMAPQATIYVYEQDQLVYYNPDEMLAAIAAVPSIQQISSSWLYTVMSPSSIDALAIQGQALFQAAGDRAAYVASGGIQPGVQTPMDLSPNMTVVGATTLSTSGNNYTSEKVWNVVGSVPTAGPFYPEGVSGGGICDGSSGSLAVSIPTYQKTFIAGINGASSTYRNIPDVSIVGDQVEIFDEGLISGSSGTSASAPLWAGISALINEYAAAQGKGPVGLLNSALYNLANNPTAYAADFNDIVLGSNNYFGTYPNLYAAVPGYDMASGLGTPKTQLIYDIVGTYNLPTNTPVFTSTGTSTSTPTNTDTATVTSSPTSTFTPSNTSTASATNTATNSATVTWTPTLTFTSTDTETSTATNTVTDSATVTWTPTPIFTSTDTGTFTATSSATDTMTASVTLTATFTLTASATSTATNSATVTWTSTATFTLSPSATNTATNSATFTATITATMTPTTTAALTITPTPTATVNAAFFLSANLFNPLAGESVTVHYGVFFSGTVKLAVYDIAGQELRELVNSTQSVGDYAVPWDGKDRSGYEAASGIYLVVIDQPGRHQLLKVLVIK